MPDTPLTEEERRAMLAAIASRRFPNAHAEQERVWLAAGAFYSERERSLREALREAADDLGKAANQFAGLAPEGNNQHIFAEKAKRARAASDPTNPAASPNPMDGRSTAEMTADADAEDNAAYEGHQARKDGEGRGVHDLTEPRRWTLTGLRLVGKGRDFCGVLPEIDPRLAHDEVVQVRQDSFVEADVEAITPLIEREDLYTPEEQARAILAAIFEQGTNAPFTTDTDDVDAPESAS